MLLIPNDAETDFSVWTNSYGIIFPQNFQTNGCLWIFDFFLTFSFNTAFFDAIQQFTDGSYKVCYPCWEAYVTWWSRHEQIWVSTVMIWTTLKKQRMSNPSCKDTASIMRKKKKKSAKTKLSVLAAILTNELESFFNKFSNPYPLVMMLLRKSHLYC